MKKVLIAVALLFFAIISMPFAASAETYYLTVASSNPSSGVAITASPNDRDGNGSGTTQFTRRYSDSTSITLTAPSTHSRNGKGTVPITPRTER